ncbi:hypothetical protein LXL04_037308 [Taraxacum kok-saghyz]
MPSLQSSHGLPSWHLRLSHFVIPQKKPCPETPYLSLLSRNRISSSVSDRSSTASSPTDNIRTAVTTSQTHLKIEGVDFLLRFRPLLYRIITYRQYSHHRHNFTTTGMKADLSLLPIFALCGLIFRCLIICLWKNIIMYIFSWLNWKREEKQQQRAFSESCRCLGLLGKPAAVADQKMVAGAQDGLDNFSVSESSQNGVSVGLCLTYANDSAMKKEATKWQKERDAWWQDVILEYSTKCDVEWVDAEDPLFLLYTSGSTGKPKGVVHTTGGYMVYTATTFKYAFDYKPSDVYWICQRGT